MAKGLMVEIYRAAGCVRDGNDCTANGVTSSRRGCTHAVLTGHGIPQIFEPQDDMPELVYVKDRIVGDDRHMAIPREQFDKGHWGKSGRDVFFFPGMFGGNYVSCSDSRMPTRYPIPVYDRIEQ